MERASKETISRRQFGKATVAAAGFGILTSVSRMAAAQSATDTLKVGLLGCGNRGGGACQQLLMGNKNVQLIAMADLFEDRLSSKRDEIRNNANPEISSKYAVDDDHCFVGFDAFEKILATDIDILVEGTLPYSRPKHLEAAVNAGKHIFTEKPVAVDPVGIRTVLAAAEKHKAAGLSFVAGTQRRHQKPYVDTIKKLHDGAIGDIVAMRVYWCGGLPFIHERKEGWSDFEFQVRNWINYCWTCGDNIVEQHVHNLDVGCWVKQAHPVVAFASGGRTWKPREPQFGDLYDNFSVDYEFEDGTHMASYSRHWDGTDGGVFEEAVGTKGRSTCRDMGEEGLDPYVQEHIDLVNSIRGEGPYLHEGQQVAESTMTAIMGRMSAYTGKRIKWDEALNSDLSIVPAEWSFHKEYPIGPVPVPLIERK